MFINLTPHAVVIFNKAEEIHTGEIDKASAKIIPPSGIVARLEEAANFLTSHEGVEICEVTRLTRRVSQLPMVKQGVYLIVSSVVAEAWRGKRFDLVFPTDFVRDANGKILGCYALGTYR